MPRPSSNQPTEVELAILKVLWEHGPCPLGTIHESLSESRSAAYSSTRKMVQVMREKGLLEVLDETVRPQQYQAVRSEAETRLGLLDELMQRAFGGSAQKLVMSLLSAERLTTDEFDELRRMIDEAQHNEDEV